MTSVKMTNRLLTGADRSGFPSPGSSVFDLPAHNAARSTLLRADTSGDKRHAPIPISHFPDPPSFIVISGGTGGNAICSAFDNEACYVLPVSDDGGSSSEIIRVLGGPSIGAFWHTRTSMTQ